MARCLLLWRFRSMAAYTEERGSGSIGRKENWSNDRIFVVCWHVRFVEETIFNWALLAAWSILTVVWRREEGAKTHSLRRQNGGAVLVTRCTSRWGSFTVLCVSVYWHFSLSFLSATSFFLVWFYQGFLNTVREFPKFVRHLVRVLKVVLFKVFLDFRFH